MRLLRIEDVLVKLDGRSCAWLTKQLRHKGIMITAQAISNYVAGRREAPQATLVMIKYVLSAPETARRLRTLK